MRVAIRISDHEVVSVGLVRTGGRSLEHPGGIHPGEVEGKEASLAMVRDALGFVMGMRRHDGLPLWAREIDAQPWDYALLTGCSSIRHALHCGAAIADLVGEPHPEWTAAADVIDRAINGNLTAFEPKDRWAMDWYYPVMTGAMTGVRAKARLAEGWDKFVLDDRGVRCVNDEQWVTAAETSECAIAHVAAGDRPCAIVDAGTRRAIDVDVVVPLADMAWVVALRTPRRSSSTMG